MRRAKLVRHWSDYNQSTGTLLVLESQTNQPIYCSVAIERGDRNNQRNVSRVPAGVYDLVYEYSPSFKMHLWELKGVRNRTECKIHPVNFWNQLNGCIAPGAGLKKINRDGYYDVYSSRATLKAFHRALKGMYRTTIEIVDEY